MDSTKAVAMESGANAIEAALVVGDLSKLTPEHRVVYYHKVCESLGLNPLTKPFQYLVLNGRLTLYATKDCTEQLRDKRKISFIKLEREKLDSLYVVTATAQTADGRVDTSIGAVNIDGLKGDALANAMMKAETKAKRRVTLSICGLGWTDESEIETIPGARRVAVDMATGEVKEPEALEESLPEELPSGEPPSAPEVKVPWNAEPGARERFERWLAQNGIDEPRDFYAFANMPFEQLPKWSTTSRMVADYLKVE